MMVLIHISIHEGSSLGTNSLKQKVWEWYVEKLLIIFDKRGRAASVSNFYGSNLHFAKPIIFLFRLF